jgi:Predicted Permease Membrane Region
VVISLLVGKHVLQLEAPVSLGAIAGQQCSTPARSAVVEKAGNAVPMLGYTMTYTLSNVVLPVCGPIVVLVTFHTSKMRRRMTSQASDVQPPSPTEAAVRWSWSNAALGAVYALPLSRSVWAIPWPGRRWR